MYLSHPVRRIRAEPEEGAEIGLVVELGDADAADLEAAVAAVGGTVREELRFDSYHVAVPEVGVDELCELDGIERIETDNTLDTVAVDEIYDEE